MWDVRSEMRDGVLWWIASRRVAPTHSTMVTASGRFLDGPWRPSGSKGFMLGWVSECPSNTEINAYWRNASLTS